MSDSAVFALLIVIGWILCAGFSAHLGGQRNAGWAGFVLGVLFGPLGMIVAGLLDCKPNCSRCGGRQNVNPDGQRFPVCEHCGVEIKRQASKSHAPSRQQQPTSAPVTLPPATCLSLVDDDPEWESSL